MYIISYYDINLSSKTYTGSSIKPSVTVKLNNKTLKLNTDYKVSYSNNKNIGTAKILIKGIGKYDGEKTVTFNIIPSKVTNLKSSKKTYNSITLSWNKINNVTGYKIYRYDKKSNSYKYLATAKTNSYTDKSLKASSTYSYKVRAYKGSLNGSYSNTIDVKTSPNYAPKVTGLKLKTQKSDSLTISWNKINNVTGYKVYRYDVKTESYKLIKTISNASTTSYTNSKLTSATKYLYKVRSYKIVNNKTHNGDYSSSLAATTKPPTPTVKLTSPSTKKIKLTWTNISSRTTGYNIYMATSKNGTYKNIGSTSKKSFTKGSLKKGKTYYFKVRAYRTIDGKKVYSSYSSIKSIKCK